MNTAPALHWLPERDGWRADLHRLRRGSGVSWPEAVSLARTRLDFVRTNMLDDLLARGFPQPPREAAGRPIRLAVLGSSTTAHLHAGLRVAALRRDLHLTTFEGDYGQYRQDLADLSSGLHAFEPTAVLFAFDARHVTAGVHAGLTAEEADALLEQAKRDIASLWRQARDTFGVPVLQQTVMPCLEPLMGSGEHRLPGSRAGFVRRLNAALREVAAEAGVHLVALDDRVAADGLGAWHDAALWHRGKQEVSPAAAPFYGELVVRVLAALQGRSAKCLVLDLDNTIWGGVVGDDGVEGLALGQGSATGEAFAAVQAYAKELSRRGIILAVCSKNDEANALDAFDRHPEMILGRGDIACFVANWTDKAANLRDIAARLSIGLDALVFLDDNPAERDLVRRELPAVAVPELADEPAFYPRALADGGYFESIGVTADDRARTDQYQANRLRQEAEAEAGATDLPGFLRGLEMRMLWRPFDRAGLPRIAQLINKTNQFNLTTRRRTEEEVLALMDDPDVLTLQLRLLDRFGDNGMVAVVIGRLEDGVLDLDTWLMSCRVLGREVEAATLDLVRDRARAMGARTLRGRYVPTAKNGMVRDLYHRLGFTEGGADASGGTVATLDIEGSARRDAPIVIMEG